MLKFKSWLDGHAATGNDLLIESQFRIIIDTNLL